jgi:cytochrome c
MKRKNFLKALGLVTLVLSTAAVRAADAGTPAEAEAMVKKVVASIKANGPEKTFDEVTNGKSYKDRDLYAYVYDLNGKCLAHGANPKLVGKDLIGLKDPDGKLVIKIVMDLAKEKGKGWTEPVKFRNPTTDKLQTRVSYIERVGDFVVGSGVYKD